MNKQSFSFTLKSVEQNLDRNENTAAQLPFQHDMKRIPV